MRAYVDTNVLLCFITGAPAEQALQSAALFKAAETGEVTLVLDEIVIAEAVWVLSSFYKFSKDEIKDVLQVIVASEGIAMTDEMGALLALTLFADLSVDFEDALISVHMSRDHIADVFTFDKHFNRLSGVKGLSPSEFMK